MMTSCTIVRMLLVNLCALLVIGFSYSSGQTTISKNVICVCSLWEEISDVDPSICTHLVYRYTYVGEEDLALRTSSFGINHTENSEKLQNFRLSNPTLKILIGVVDFLFYSEEPITIEKIQKFANQAVDNLRTWNLDGIDWMYRGPATEILVTFIEEVHAAFMAEAASSGREPLILMLSASAWGFINETVDLHPLGQAIDILHASPEGYTTKVPVYNSTYFASPMYGNGGLYGNVAASIADFLDAEIPPEKLHIGIHLHANTYTLLDPENTGVGAPAHKGGERGKYTSDSDTIAYYEVCIRLQEEGYTAQFDFEGQVKFAYKGDQWMTYEDTASLEIKMNYVHDHNLGGVVAMYVDKDDYTGEFCNQGTYPQISTLYRFATRNITTTTAPITTTAQPQACSSGIVYKYLPDPYSCEHYRICAFGQLFRYKCLLGLSFDSERGYCIKNPTTACVTIPDPCE